MSDVQTWNVAAGSNNSAAPNGFPEGMPPSGVNDAAREVMAAVARYRSDTDGVNTSSGTNTITLAASRTMTAYAQGDLFTFKAGGTNTGATTLNVDSLGAKDVQFNGAACVGGEIVSGLMYTVVYDGTQFQLMNAASYPAIDITTLEVTNIKAKDGTAAATIADSTGKITVSSELAVDNINISGNKVEATSGDLTFDVGDGQDIILLPGAFGGGAVTITGDLEIDAIRKRDPLAPSIIVDADGGIFGVLGGTVIEANNNTYAALRVTQTGTANALEVEDSANPDATPFVIDKDGKVINGYTTAVTINDAGGNQVSSDQVHGLSTANSMRSIFNWGSGAPTRGSLYICKSKSGAIGTNAAVSSGDTLGGIFWAGDDGTGFYDAAAITSTVDGTVSAGAVPARLTFSTQAQGATERTNRMSIAASGNIGIGSNPVTVNGATIDISGNNNGLSSDSVTNTLRFTDADTTTAANQPIGKIEFYNLDTDNPAVASYILSSAVGTSGGGTIRFGASANAGSASEIARVGATGLTVTADAAALGYGAGSGGAVTQATSRTTGVTLDKTNGAITLVSAAGSTTIQSFTVTNSTVAATDTIIVNQKSGTDLYRIYVTAVAAGSFRISYATLNGTTTEQPVFNFAVIKAVTS